MIKRFMIQIAILTLLGMLCLAGAAAQQDEPVTAAGADSMEAMERSLFAVELEPGAGWLAGKSVMEQPLQEHAQYHSGLYAAGKLYMGGPYLDNGGGLVILRAFDMEEAQALVDNDPAVRDDIFTATIHPYMPVFNFPEGYSWEAPADSQAEEGSQD